MGEKTVPGRPGRGSVALSPEDGALLDAVRTLRWPARRLAPASLVGAHLSPVRGVADEFTEYRAYRPGDDPSRLDWKLLARSDRAYIRLSQERVVLPTTLILDASASLAYPAETYEKWHHARRITLGLAAAAHRGSDPVGLVVATASGPVRLPPRTRRGVVHEIARTLARVQPAGSPALAPLLATGRTRGRIVLVSDFLGAPETDETERLLRVASQLAAAGAEVYAVHLLHPTELDPGNRAALVSDPERATLRRPLTEQTRQRYLESFTAWRADLTLRWRRTGAVYIEAVTTEPAALAVRRIVTAGVGGAGQGSAGSANTASGTSGAPRRGAR